MQKLLLITFAFLSLVSCAQSKYGIVRSYAYLRPELPGTVTEDNRHPSPDTIYLVYLDTKPGTTIKWTRGYIGTGSYKILPMRVPSPYTIGILQNATDSTTLRAKKGDRLWQLTLERDKDAAASNKSVATGHQILLRGRYRNKNISYRIRTIKTLQPHLHE